MRHSLQWIVGHSDSPERRPDDMVPASVPGNANLDWAAARGLPDWKSGVNYKQYQWMEDCWWLYEAVLPDIRLAPGETLFFVAKGIDYEYAVLLDGRELCRHEGMFSGIEIPIDLNGTDEPADALQPRRASGMGLLQIWIAPPPKDAKAKKGTRAEAAQSCKPAVSYGWDWHPRLIPSGMWDDAYLEIRPPVRFADAYVDYELAEDYSHACLTFTADIAGPGKASLTLFDPEGKSVLQIPAGGSAVLNSPELWWCNGYGKPSLYRWQAVLHADGKLADSISGTIGFRKAELAMNEGAWQEPANSPITRCPAPITIKLNGVPVFAKGSNWANPEVFTGIITEETYAPLIKYAKEANFNILRCWGGAIVNKDSFYSLCDEHGIMVWQEFPLACNDYYATPRYLRILEQEAGAIVRRLKRRACIVLWCGGNELFNSWSGMTDQSEALRLLNKICYELDPGRPFMTTSPLTGMAHGNYYFRYQDGREVFQVMPDARYTAYTEFGVSSISNPECLSLAAGGGDVFPLEINEFTIAHHAFEAYENQSQSWACLDTIRDYFGEARTLEQLVDWSQWLQGEGYKCIFEEARRQKPYCSMALNWCYNEPWPALANNSIINYPASPKSSYYDVADSCRGALISARIPKFAWESGESFYADLWLLNDGTAPVSCGQAAIIIELDGAIYPVYVWNYGRAEANTNIEGPTVRLQLPYIETDGFMEMKLIIQAGGLSSHYRLLYNGK